MPKEYEEIRDSYVAKGVPLAKAKSIAAATWNKRHPKDTNPWLHEGARYGGKKGEAANAKPRRYGGK